MFLEYIKKYEKNSLIINLLMILVSILLIVNPNGILNLVMIIFGIGVIIDGIFHVISFFRTEKEYKFFGGDLFEGILAIVAGVFILFNKTLIFSFIQIVIGAWIIVRSILKLQIAFNLKDNNSSKWVFVLISSIITFLLGVLVIINPFASMIAVTVVVGIILLVSSIVDLIETLTILNVLK